MNEVDAERDLEWECVEKGFLLLSLSATARHPEERKAALSRIIPLHSSGPPEELLEEDARTHTLQHTYRREGQTGGCVIGWGVLSSSLSLSLSLTHTHVRVCARHM